MAICSKVAMLAAAVRAELDCRIVERAFSGYQALAEWLQAQRYHSAMKRAALGRPPAAPARHHRAREASLPGRSSAPALPPMLYPS
jgi:hypothetical protein